MSTAVPPTDDAPVPPRRLDPRTVLIRSLKGSPSAIVGLLPLVLAWSQGRSVPLGLLAMVFVLVATIAVLSSWLAWHFFTYQILPGQLVIERGLIRRTRRSIPAERIQDVSITQGPLSRVLGLAQVRIETGGGEADEGLLDSVSLAEAHRLRAVLRSIRAGGNQVGDGATIDGHRSGQPGDLADEAETTVFRLGFGRLLFSGLFKFSLVWIVAIFGLLQYFDQALGYDREQWLDLYGAAEREVQSRLNAPVLFGAAGAALVLGLLAGVVRTVLRNFGFTLSHTGARFRYRRGLLTRTEVVVAQRQIQLGLVERGALSGRLGWRAFKVQTLGGSDEASGRQELAPFARPAEIAPLVDLAGLPPFERSGLQPVSASHRLGGLGAPLILAVGIVGLAATVFLPAALLLLTLIVPLAVAVLRPRFHRYHLAETSIQVTRGVLTGRDWTVPYGNVQAITIRRGPIQRLLGLVTVRIDTAGGGGLHSPHVQDLDEAAAASLVRELTDRVTPADSP
ncbi:PH domain-containing protein [Brevundimonas sp. R86498]|uniref:PH domain-containing protein n=1 Tax=Brevundimonas sp. R86498 TaxID=3093845 RepID=UPI0037CC2F63